MQKQRGFTLIELIIVIVILGILAVAAAPRFINFGSDARASTVEGLAGAMQGAADVVYGRSAVQGIETQEFDDGNYPNTESPAIEVQFGYPAATEGGIQEALSFTASDWDIATENDEGDDDRAMRFAPAGYFEDTDFADLEECSVTYTESQEVDERPVIEVSTVGC